MPIELTCGECKKKLRVKDEFAGSRIRCPKCSRSLKVPAPTVDPDESDDDVEEPVAVVERTKKCKIESGKKAVRKRGIPLWVWLTAGGVGLLVVAVVVLVLVLRSGRSAPRKNGAIDVAAPGPAAGSDDKAEMAEEFFKIQEQNSIALSKCKDAAGLNATTQLFRVHSEKLRELDRRYRTSKDPRHGVLLEVSEKYPKAMRNYDREINRLQGAIRLLNASPQEVQDFDAAYREMRAAIIQFLEAADADR